MHAQYIDAGVLIRPGEGFATNFLSSRYYDGRAIVDALVSPDAAAHWMRVQAAALQAPATAFVPSAADLAALNELRNRVESLYRGTVDGEAGTTLTVLGEILSSIRLQPTIGEIAGRPQVAWSGAAGGLDEVIAAVAVSATSTVTGRASTVLRRCEAPRCVLYYTQHNSRQHWCSPVCGNRARVANSAAASRSS